MIPEIIMYQTKDGLTNEGELTRNAVDAKFATTAADGNVIQDQKYLLCF